MPEQAKKEKNYLDGFIIKEFIFPNTGNSILKIGVKVDDFIDNLNKIKNEKGWANVVITERKEVSDKGITHSIYEDDFKPEPQESKNSEDDELPF